MKKKQRRKVKGVWPGRKEQTRENERLCRNFCSSPSDAVTMAWAGLAAARTCQSERPSLSVSAQKKERASGQCPRERHCACRKVHTCSTRSLVALDKGGEEGADKSTIRLVDGLRISRRADVLKDVPRAVRRLAGPDRLVWLFLLFLLVRLPSPPSFPFHRLHSFSPRSLLPSLPLHVSTPCNVLPQWTASPGCLATSCPICDFGPSPLPV